MSVESQSCVSPRFSVDEVVDWNKNENEFPESDPWTTPLVGFIFPEYKITRTGYITSIVTACHK